MLNDATHIIILAAGKGSRMRSNEPKVLAKLANKYLLSHVISAAQGISSANIHVVIGHGADDVKQAFSNSDCHINWCLQEKQLGTGDAVNSALSDIPNNANVLVLYGDVPLIKPKTLQLLIDALSTSDLCILTAELDSAEGYGRIIRDTNQQVKGIIEQKDASESELCINEINTGILSAKAKKLKHWLKQVKPNNNQQEFYLTDIVGIAYAEACAINSVTTKKIAEISGVNCRSDLAKLERSYQNARAESFLEKGLTLADPMRFDIRGNLEFGTDCFIDINVILNGDVTLGDNVQIHANSILSNCHIADNSVIHPNSILEECTVGKDANIGPFARIRPGSHLSDNVRVGNFVELKKTSLGTGAKVNHLSYIGDSDVGKDTNIGAGTITCNYDGANKFKTIIGQNAFIGSNSQLVAPVNIADGATVAAGSTITSDVPKESLAVARSKQRNLSGWQRPKKNK